MTHIDGPNNIGKVNTNINVANNVTEVSVQSVNSTFGDGFSNRAEFGIGIEKNICGLAELLQSGKFDFEAPIYPKGGFAQFNPSDADFAGMKHLDNILDKPELVYSEA